MPFRRLFQRRRRADTAHDLYAAAVAQARLPTFYAALGVPDTVDGRFDLLVLHAHLLMRRLGRIAGEDAKTLSQALFDLMFADMDNQLREMGVTDLAVGRKVRQMAEAFYGRVAAYDAALAEGEGALALALERNLFRAATAPAAAAAAAYVIAQEAHLAALADADVLAGRVSFATGKPS